MIDTEINAAATAIPTLCSFNKLEIIIIMCIELIHNSAINYDQSCTYLSIGILLLRCTWSNLYTYQVSV